jgi:hypothetical protein
LQIHSPGFSNVTLIPLRKVLFDNLIVAELVEKNGKRKCRRQTCARATFSQEDHRRHKHSPRKRRNGDTAIGYSGQAALRREQCGIFAQSKNYGARRKLHDNSM